MEFIIQFYIYLRFCNLLQNKALLTSAESRLVEDKKQYDLMQESKQLELSRHLKNISQRNDQVLSLAINLYGYHIGSFSNKVLTVRRI